jgi:hypothetical protein
MNRLKVLADFRRTAAPEHLKEFASSIAGFSEPIIERACSAIERSERGERETGFPDLGRLLNECRAAAQSIREDSNTWSLTRYKDCLMFDRYLADQVKHYKRTTHEICEAHPAMARAWAAWKNQLAAGTLICPQWCDACEGQRYLVTVDDKGDRWARRCPHCREGAA